MYLQEEFVVPNKKWLRALSSHFVVLLLFFLLVAIFLCSLTRCVLWSLLWDFHRMTSLDGALHNIVATFLSLLMENCTYSTQKMQIINKWTIPLTHLTVIE